MFAVSHRLARRRGLVMSDLHNIQPDMPVDPTGKHRVRGLRMSKGVYRSGRFAGRQYARFTYELCDVPGRRQASQMLPWLPGIAFFETNFRLLTGITWQQFKARVAEQGMDADAKRRFFAGLFVDVEYDAQLRQQDKWLNVWRLEHRHGAPDNPAADPAPRHDTIAKDTQANTEPAAETPAGESEEMTQADMASAQRAVSKSDDLDARIRALAPQVGLDDGGLERLAMEEFSVSLAAMSSADKVTLLELMEEHRMLGEPFGFQEGS